MKRGRMRKILFLVVSIFLQCFYVGLTPVQKLEKYNETIPVSNENKQVVKSNIDIFNDVHDIDKSNNTLKTNTSSLNKTLDDEIELFILDTLEKSKNNHKKLPSLDKTSKTHEKEMFENGNNKTNNVSERSFIWLNTRYIRPLKTKIYNYSVNELKSQRRLRPAERFHILNKALTNKKQQMSFVPPPYILFPPDLAQRKSNTPRPLFTPFHDFSKIPCNMPGHFAVDKKVNMKCVPVLSKPAMYEQFRQQLPFIMPHYKTVINNGNKPAEIINPLTSNVKSYAVEPQKPNRQNQHVTSITRHKVKDSYGYPTSYQLHRSTFTTNDMNYKPEELVNYEGNLYSDNNYVLSPVDVTDDEDKLLERYIKHTLADNGVHILDEELNTKCPECEQNNNTDCMCRLDAQEIKNKLYNYIERKSGHIEIESKNLEPGNKLDYDEPLLLDETVLNKTLSDVFFSSDNKINDMHH